MPRSKETTWWRYPSGEYSGSHFPRESEVFTPMCKWVFTCLALFKTFRWEANHFSINFLPDIHGLIWLGWMRIYIDFICWTLIHYYYQDSLCSNGRFCASLVPGMNTSPLSLVWLASMVANGDDTNGLEHSQESAAAARWKHTRTDTFIVANL